MLPRNELATCKQQPLFSLFVVAGMADSAFDARESLPLVESTRDTHVEHGAAQHAARFRDGDGVSEIHRHRAEPVSASSRLLQGRRAVSSHVAPRRRSSSAWCPQNFVEQGAPA